MYIEGEFFSEENSNENSEMLSLKIFLKKFEVPKRILLDY